MVENEKKAIKSLRNIIIRARTMSYEEEKYKNIADILDGTEYLLSLIYEEDDKTERFKSYLKYISEKHKCLWSYDSYMLED